MNQLSTAGLFRAITGEGEQWREPGRPIWIILMSEGQQQNMSRGGAVHRVPRGTQLLPERRWEQRRRNTATRRKSVNISR